ncbi:MAG: nucleotidyltransferase domain-containing protein [Alphaproteobacteria bacterium]
MLQLTTEEQAWPDGYRAALDKQHPGAVQEMLIYGSKARGRAHAESDLDLLWIVKNGSGKLKKRAAEDRLPTGGNHGRFALDSCLHPRRQASVKLSSATRCATYEPDA